MKNRIYFLLVFIFCSCSVLKRKNFNLSFASLYEKDFLTLTINDSLFFKQKLISTNAILGIDLKNDISIKDKKINLQIKFNSIIEKEFNLKRTVKLDTVLNVKDGYNIIIFADYDKIKIEQKKKKYILE